MPPGRRFPLSEADQGAGGGTAETEVEYTNDNSETVKLKKAATKRIKAVLGEAKARSQSEVPQGFQNPEAIGLDLQKQLHTAIQALQKGLVERDTEVRLLLLAALAGEHILFIGPPGTAKSELGRRLASLYSGTFFERLLTRFSVPEELFGPLSMKALENDQYLRKTDGYLPGADIAFIDEIFKANSAILNSLLTLLNERLFDNGTSRFQVPLTCLVGASNELPESEELDALYDRFLLRRRVEQVTSGALADMLQGSVELAYGGVAPSQVAGSISGVAIAKERFQNVREEALRRVQVPLEVIDLLTDLRTYLQEKCEPPVYVSDRRLIKALNLLQVAAYTSGQLSVSTFDCLLLQHVLWQRPDESRRIADYIMQQLAADDGMQQAEYLLTGMYARACARSSGKTPADEETQREVTALRSALAGKLAEVQAVVASEETSLSRANMWLGKDETEAVVLALGPKLEKTAKELERLIGEVVTLEVAVEHSAQAWTLAGLLPKRWSEFLKKGDKDDVSKFSTRPGKRSNIPFANKAI